MNALPCLRASIHHGMSRCALMLAVWAFCSGSAVRADISFVDMFRNNAFQQTGNGNTLASNGSFFSADLTSTGANDFNSVQMTYPGPGSPTAIPQISPTAFHFQPGSFPTQAAMDAAFPFGTYQFNATNGITPATTSFQYSSDDYSRSLPFLTGTNYSDLQGMNPSQPFTFTFSPFVTGNLANSSFVFFTIFDLTTNAFVYNGGFLPATTTGVVLPANTLTPGHQFSYELDFSNRDLVPSPGAVFAAQLGFDVRTTGVFTTAAAVPEPSAAMLTGLGMLIGLGYAWPRRKASHA
jgi:hypothetical protein